MDEIALEKSAAFYATFEFKGRELEPFSEGRRAVAASIGVRFNSGDDSDSGPRKFETCITDIHAIIFICQCDKKTLSRAHRDPDGFWAKVLEWADENITPADYQAEADVASRILQAAFSTQVEGVRDETSPAGPSGN